MLDYLRTTKEKTIFFVLSALLFVLLLLIRYLLLPLCWTESDLDWGKVLRALADAITHTVLTTALITALLLWLLPARARPGDVTLIASGEIRHHLKESVRNTREYRFRGRSGRFFRSYVLPNLAKDAKAQNRKVRVRVQVLDPRATNICERYAEYRNKLRQEDGDAWTPERIRNESVATIVAAYAWASDHYPVEISVSLNHWFSLFRLDQSDGVAVLTREDPQAPAIMASKGTSFYDSFSMDFDLSDEQSARLGIAKTLAPDVTTESSVEKLMADLKICVPLGEADLMYIVDAVKSPKDPYG